MAPTLQTPRIRLTPHRPSDLDEMTALLGDPAVVGPIGVPPSTRKQCWHRLLRYMGHWTVAGYGHWVVRDLDGVFLGEVGLMDSRRVTVPNFEGTPEAGWVFGTAAQGRGFAGEACAAMLAWADGHGLPRTVCIVGPGNAPSLRLAERLGYRRWAEGTYSERPTVFLERHA
jgi:RimJ/RimL family protein N-acetyltransferase